jgi:putative ABC transport system substrate-binding protein
MDRRRFLLSSLGGVLAAPLAAEGQQSGKVRRVGFFTLNPSAPGNAALTLEVFRQGLTELSYNEGKNLTLEKRFAEGRRELLPALARELVAMPVDVIVTLGTPATVAARDATSSVPIVFIGVGDPVGSGFAASLAHPGGNLTGLSFVGPELAAKNLELLKQAAPEVSRVAVLVPGDGTQPLVRAVWTELERAALRLHVTLQRLQVLSAGDHLDNALATLRARRPDALLTLNDPVFFIHRERILSTAAELRLPTMFQTAEYVRDGGLLAYVPSVSDQAKRAASYVVRILNGARPGDLPVEQPTKFELVINLKTAKALGLTIPPSLLARADHVIE